MRIGFTGTRKGMTSRQKEALSMILTPHMLSLDHGGCHGADTEAHQIAGRNGVVFVYVRPGDNNQWNKWKHLKECCYRPQPYLKRNKKIVDTNSLIIAAPSSLKEEQRSGTWATIRYARKINKPVIILDP